MEPAAGAFIPAPGRICLREEAAHGPNTRDSQRHPGTAGTMCVLSGSPSTNRITSMASIGSREGEPHSERKFASEVASSTMPCCSSTALKSAARSRSSSIRKFIMCRKTDLVHSCAARTDGAVPVRDDACRSSMHWCVRSRLAPRGPTADWCGFAQRRPNGAAAGRRPSTRARRRAASPNKLRNVARVPRLSPRRGRGASASEIVSGKPGVCSGSVNNASLVRSSWLHRPSQSADVAN